MAITEMLRLLISADTQGAVRGIEQVGKTADRELSRSEKSLDRWGNRLTSVGSGLLAFGAVAAYGLGQAARSAGELEQAVGGTEAVFGEAGQKIDEYAKGAAESVGLSQAAFRDLTTVAGAQLKNLGFSVDEAADKSIQLTEIGADLAATYGGTTQEAVEALGAAFRGEADPAERFGLRLNINTANAKAVAMGLAESTSAVSDHARAQAILALIMEQSADAQGQFAREGDTLAGQQQRLTAQFEDLKASIGEGAIPVMKTLADVTSTVVGGLSDANSATGGFLGKAATVVTIGALAAGGLSLMVGQAIKMRDTFVTLKDGAASLTGKLGGLGRAAAIAGGVAGVAGLAAALDAMEEAQNAEDIKDMAEAFVAMGDGIDASWNAMLRSWVGPIVVKDVFAELRDSNVEAAERLLDTAEAAGVAQSTIDEMRASLDQKRDADAQGQVDAEAYNATLEEGADAAANQAGEIENLTDAIDGLLSQWFTVEEAARAQNDAMAQVDEQLAGLREEYGAEAMSLDLATEAGRRNSEMLQGLFEDTGAVISAMDESGSTSEELRAQWAADRAELSAVIERFRAAGVDVSAYDARLAEIDRLVETTVMADTAKAWGDISAIGDHLGRLDGKSATVKVFRKFFDELPGSMWNFGGPRALGGPVKKGSIYEVTEGDIPELLEEGGRTYLMPGRGGRVVPIGEMGSGGSFRAGGDGGGTGDDRIVREIIGLDGTVRYVGNVINRSIAHATNLITGKGPRAENWADPISEFGKQAYLRMYGGGPLAASAGGGGTPSRVDVGLHVTGSGGFARVIHEEVRDGRIQLSVNGQRVRAA